MGSEDKIYRVSGTDTIGPDYKCSKCSRTGLRLWRQTNTMLVHIKLLCAFCAEDDQAKKISEYAKSFRDDTPSPFIGDLVPARPTLEGDNFWGHASGDVLWWYKLPQYDDPKRELSLVIRERDHERLLAQVGLSREAELYKRLGEVQRALENLQAEVKRKASAQ